MVEIEGVIERVRERKREGEKERERKREGEKDRGRERERERKREGEKERGRERGRVGERERCRICPESLFLFFKGMAGALAPYSYLVA